MYEWDHEMEAALEIVMDYLDRTGQTASLKEAQSSAVKAIAMARKAGVRHRIKLADAAIKAVEHESSPHQNHG